MRSAPRNRRKTARRKAAFRRKITKARLRMSKGEKKW